MRDRGVNQRISKYKDRLFYTPSGQAQVGEGIPYVLKGMKERMIALETSHFAALTGIDQRCSVLLNEEAVSPCQVVWYKAFARQVYKLSLQFYGGTLKSEVNILMQRWVAEGFTQAILERIRDVVFTLEAPGP